MRAVLLLALLGCSSETPRLLAVTAPTDTRNTVGPYTVHIAARAVGDAEIQVLHSTAGELFFPVLADEHGRDDLYAAAIPGQPAGTTVRFFVAVVDGTVQVAREPEEADAYFTFRVLGASLACRVDSDCRPDELCADGTCRPFSGECVDSDAGPSCPGGYMCDPTRSPPLCVILPTPCATDVECPTVMECSLDDVCVARVPCLDTPDCPPGHTCNSTIGLCYR